MYIDERGTDVYAGRPTSWVGKVGLMYPSDYAYTFAYQSDSGVQICYIDTWSCRNGVWNNVTFTGTPTASWLYKNNEHQWTISPAAKYSYSAYIVYLSGYVNHPGSDDSLSARPTVYLRSDVLLTGTGTEEDPYKILG